ncbi:MAG: hypothetical protein KBF88_07065 [Polyangiaceae bacterium]|nr:hypothetical protein [Polyangiaceae bacterium]
MNKQWALLSALLLGTFFGCYADPEDSTGQRVTAGNTENRDASAKESTILPANAPSNSDMPCEVSSFLNSYCSKCHGSALRSGAPMPLTMRADLLKASSLAGRSNAVLSLERVEAGTMPPSGSKPSGDEIAAFKRWVVAGAPEGSCNAPAAPQVDAGPDEFAAAPQCTSNVTWTRGNRKSPEMNPGKACKNCHDSATDDDPPNLTFGGTVYPTAHEPDLCLGVGPGAITVEVTDANNKVASVRTNASGNFLYEGSLSPPFRVRLIGPKGERRMAKEAPHGDCNLCHTQTGANGAPGRILAPSGL